ncbi:hypothetical protein HYALB_00002698 [Hymenoscyphus albidus]|uniref:Berberine/berberine-like domain-containing protein n=1 Tax=Hymenoscyphus albidus TaxID=595503 RepID=A0A9N9M0S9_9HELO|nr:hypothetical protein HYALB_00002698 [Hymenoscyphus albidus]
MGWVRSQGAIPTEHTELCSHRRLRPQVSLHPLVRWGQNYTEPSYESKLWYNGNVRKPEVFKDYQGSILPENNSTVLRQMTMGQFAASLKPSYVRVGESSGKIQLFHVVSHTATITSMRVVHDTFLDGIQKHNLKKVDQFFSSIAYNTITPAFAKLSQGMPQGIPQEAAFWSEQAVSWVKPEGSPKVRAFIDDVNANITAQLEKSGELRPYLYLNDAELSQPVFQGYPLENLARLKEIRAKYDPNRVYTDQMPGGFKVEHA